MAERLELERLDFGLPPFLKGVLWSRYNPNPFLVDEDWVSMPCYMAAMSLYTGSFHGCIDVFRVLNERMLAMKIVPTILDECFLETWKPEQGDIPVFYNHRGIVHVHAGIYTGIYGGEGRPQDRIIISKLGVGNLPFVPRPERLLTVAYQADTVRYWTPKKGPKKLNLESIYL